MVVRFDPISNAILRVHAGVSRVLAPTATAENSITMDERYCRGDWDEPKSEASKATIPVNRSVIERIHRLRILTVKVKAGLGTRKYKVVKSDGPNDLVFQSVKDGKPMRDNNILSRWIKPAGRKLEMLWVNWLVIRRSHDNWLRMAGADLKDRQAQMRHAHPKVTAEVYDQFIPENQRNVVDKVRKFCDQRDQTATREASASPAHHRRT